MSSEKRRTNIRVIVKFEDMVGLSRHRPRESLIRNKGASKKRGGHAIAISKTA